MDTEQIIERLYGKAQTKGPLEIFEITDASDLYMVKFSQYSAIQTRFMMRRAWDVNILTDEAEMAEAIQKKKFEIQRDLANEDDRFMQTYLKLAQEAHKVKTDRSGKRFYTVGEGENASFSVDENPDGITMKFEKFSPETGIICIEYLPEKGVDFRNLEGEITREEPLYTMWRSLGRRYLADIGAWAGKVLGRNLEAL